MTTEDNARRFADRYGANREKEMRKRASVVEKDDKAKPDAKRGRLFGDAGNGERQMDKD